MAVVLVVEDEEQVRVLAESILQEAGHETISAANVEESSILLQSDHAIDLLFVDLGMDEDFQGGIRVAQEAAKLRPGLPVLYTTGRGITDGMKALFVEPYGFLAKPYTMDELTTALANLLRPRVVAKGSGLAKH
jgi:DNA-binding NtrC family response regulator